MHDGIAEGPLHERMDVAGGHGASEEEPLAEVTAELHEAFVLPTGFDTLRDDRHAEQVGQLDDREDDGVTRSIVLQVGDEPLVDLDNIDRESLR